MNALGIGKINPQKCTIICTTTTPAQLSFTTLAITTQKETILFESCHPKASRAGIIIVHDCQHFCQEFCKVDQMSSRPSVK